MFIKLHGEKVVLNFYKGFGLISGSSNTRKSSFLSACVTLIYKQILSLFPPLLYHEET